MKHLRLTSPVLALGLLMPALTASADTLLNDVFADSSRAETSLPTESAVWISHPAAVLMGAGSLRYTQSGGSQKMWTYFAGNGTPVSVGVGQQLVATIDFTPRTALYNNNGRSFRFGLFYDSTNPQVTSDLNSDGGGTGSPWTDSRGYGVQIALSTGVSLSANANVGKRTDLLNASLMGSGGAWTFTSSGSPIINSLDTLYTMTLELDRVAVDQMAVTFTISDVNGVVSTHSILDDPNGVAAFGTAPIATQFDQLFFRFSNNTQTADVLDFSRLRVDIVPEPSMLALAGLGLLGFALRRRTRG